jgi:hypothetical protein
VLEVYRPRGEAMVTGVVPTPQGEAMVTGVVPADIPFEISFQGLFTKVQSPPLLRRIWVCRVMLHVPVSAPRTAMSRSP